MDTITEKFIDLDRVWLEIYDWDGDNRADWIRISNYLYANNNNSNGPYSYGAETISFYQGQGELNHMLQLYGSHLERLRSMTIPSNEQGTTKYRGEFNGLRFKPIDNQLIKDIFTTADSILTHSVLIDGEFSPKFGDAIKKIMETKVLTYPAEWNNFGD